MWYHRQINQGYSNFIFIVFYYFSEIKVGVGFIVLLTMHICDFTFPSILLLPENTLLPHFQSLWFSVTSLTSPPTQIKGWILDTASANNNP